MNVRTPSITIVIGLSFLMTGCPKRDQPPKSSYDPDLVEVAEELSEENQLEQNPEQQSTDKQVKGECQRSLDNCKDGYVCWDSLFCRQDNPDQCSSQGDRLCHKKCNEDSDCPQDMPRCIEKPIFKHSDRGVLEKFCVR